MQKLHKVSQMSKERDSHAKTRTQRKAEESPNALTHNVHPLENVSCRIGDNACAAKHVSAIQRTGVFHPIKESHKVQSLLRLQRLYGNQFVQRTIAQHAIQTKLQIGQPGDIYEQEADRIAEQVMGMSEPQVQRQPVEEVEEEIIQSKTNAVQTPVIQWLYPECREKLQRMPIQEEKDMLQRRAEDDGELQVSHGVQSQIDRLRGMGQPLPESVRAYFEPRFGYDFSGVRMHTGAQAAKTAQSINARAFTVGKDVAFGAGQYSPETSEGKRLLAHELTHVVQQEGAVPRPVQSEVSRPSTASQRTSEQAISQVSDVIQRAGNPAAIPPGMRCPPDFTPGRLAGTDLLFPVGDSTITPAHTRQLTTFRTTWLAAGGTDDIIVHGYASTDGEQGPNWTLSCDRAEAVQTELVRLGIPAVRINVDAHGESTDFGPSKTANRHAVVSTRSAGILPLPLVGGILTPLDNFTGRSTTRFGVGEVIRLSFFSLPPRPAADFGGLQWHLATGGGTLAGVTNVGTATYTAPAVAGAVRLELRVATGATAGRVISSHAITIVIPSGVNITEVPGTAPNFSPAGPIPAGTWGAGFQGNVFVDPKDVSFQGVVFGEGTVAAVVTPAGSFLSLWAGLAHPVNTFGPGHAGNATTGTPVSPPPDNIFSGSRGPAHRILGVPICGASDFLWAIPWEFSVAGGPRTRFAGGFTANHHVTSTLFCDATIEKAGAGPFVRPI